MSRIEGVWATLLLPIGADGEIDFGALGDEIEILAGSGVHGIYSNGTAGEFYNQTETEFDRIQSLLAKICSARGLPFQIGACHMSPRLSFDRIRRTRALRPAAFQVILPDWSPLSEAEMRRFLERMAEAADPIPLVLYNPPHAKQALPLAQLGALADAVPAIAGMKLAGGGDDWFAEMRSRLGGVSVFIPGHNMATGCLRGGAGSYSNVACLSPTGAAHWWDLLQRDPPAAIALEQRIVAFLEDEILPFRSCDDLSNQGLDKLLAAIGGWGPVGVRLLWPHRSASETDIPRLRAEARRRLPELFRSDVDTGAPAQ